MSQAGEARPARVRTLGRQPYEPVWRAMQRFTDARDEACADEIWLVEHDPVFTLGQAGKPEHVLAAGDIPVIHVDRGGQVTYHGPGQIVAYPLFDLKRLKVGVRDYVCKIEQAMIDTLAEWNVHAERKDGAPGVYVAGAKIGALGIRVRHGCTFHGLAFNIAMGVRKGNVELKARLEQVLERKRDENQAVLHSFGVPLLPLPAAAVAREATDGARRKKAAR